MTLALLALVPLVMPSWLDPQNIINSTGPWALWVVAFIIFAECGLFSLLPGDSLLFTVGMLVAGAGTAEPAIHYGNSVTTWAICGVVLTIAAILGNVVGYWLGHLIGPPLFKPRSGFMGKVFDPRYVEMSHEFFERYGSRALVLARFVPMVRTFITLVAGVSKMNFRRFIFWTAVGGVLWVWLIMTLGYFLGQLPWVRNNIEVMLILIVAISVIPMAVEYWRSRGRKPAKA